MGPELVIYSRRPLWMTLAVLNLGRYEGRHSLVGLQNLFAELITERK